METGKQVDQERQGVGRDRDKEDRGFREDWEVRKDRGLETRGSGKKSKRWRRRREQEGEKFKMV